MSGMWNNHPDYVCVEIRFSECILCEPIPFYYRSIVVGCTYLLRFLENERPGSVEMEQLSNDRIYDCIMYFWSMEEFDIKIE